MSRFSGYENYPPHTHHLLPSYNEVDYYRTIHDYIPSDDARMNGSIELIVPDIIEVKHSSVGRSDNGDPFWMEGLNQRTNANGYFPDQYVELVSFIATPPTLPPAILEELSHDKQPPDIPPVVTPRKGLQVHMSEVMSLGDSGYIGTPNSTVKRGEYII